MIQNTISVNGGLFFFFRLFSAFLLHQKVFTIIWTQMSCHADGWIFYSNHGNLKKEVESLPIKKEFYLQVHFSPLLPQRNHLHHWHLTIPSAFNRAYFSISPSGHNAWGPYGNLGAQENIFISSKIKKNIECTKPAWVTFVFMPRQS